VVPAPSLVIVGRSPMAHTLAELARAIGWQAELVDADDFTSASAGEGSMVVVATQGHGDEEAVGQAVAARPAYLGLVGSRKRGAAVLGYLADRGVPREQLDKVHVPAGLDLGSTTHQEIAVAILAELVSLRAAGTLPAGRDPAGVASQRPAQITEATDPVCGMTVTADRSGLPLKHDGVTYYFCGTGCRQAFEQDRSAVKSSAAKSSAAKRREGRC
jgi:xanthine dehydrogenase accessory factor